MRALITSSIAVLCAAESGMGEQGKIVRAKARVHEWHWSVGDFGGEFQPGRFPRQTGRWCD